jgi:AraC-like DNA-binding protein
MDAPTPAQSRALAGIVRQRDRLAKAERTVAQMRAERVSMYRGARALDPPCTFEDIADAAGISAAAVQRALAKADNPKPHGRPGRPRGSVSKKAKL